jgi:uncharacterized protein (DUF433 family)
MNDVSQTDSHAGAIDASRPLAGGGDRSVQIVDRGRGAQLSTSRITVQDIVPYLQKSCTWEEVRAIMPILTLEEFRAVEQYVRDHYDAVMEQDRRIRERNAARAISAEVQEIRRRGHAKAAALSEQFGKDRAAEANGDPSPG